MDKTLVYVVDDDSGFCEAMESILDREGFECKTFLRGDEALAAIAASDPHVVFLDLRLGSEDGIEVLKEILELKPQLPVAMITAFGEVESAVQAIKIGAFDFLQKSKQLNRDALRAVVLKALQQRKLQIQLQQARSQLKESYQMIGSSSALTVLRKKIAKVAPTEASVVITGETGVGKELVARAIHYESPRYAKRFEAINCAAIAPTLLESELFGIEKGTATGVEKRSGRLEAAAGGTLFLDEIGDMKPDIQVELLRVLQEREFQRVGGREVIPLDVRVIAGTNQDLSRLISEGKFREDLFYRLNVVSVPIPPLRERADDIEPLARAFLSRYCATYNRWVELSKESMDLLRSHEWPGNVRELENMMERLVAEQPETNPVEPEELRTLCAELTNGADSRGAYTLSAALQHAEGEAVNRALKMADGNVTKAAAILGVERSSLHRIMRRRGM